MLSGVTWEYADGVSNNTAEIISLAAVYYQQDWPSSNEIVNMFSSDDKAFFTFCRDLSGYALDVTAKESHPYSCLIKGGCVLGYRDNGQKSKSKTTGSMSPTTIALKETVIAVLQLVARVGMGF